MSRVMTLGTFDLPHAGHMALLRECRKLAGPDGYVIAAVNRSGFVARFKSRPPVMHDDERAAVVAACRYVDEVVFNDGLAQPALIESCRPDWLAIGMDWAARDYLKQVDITAEWLRERGISLAYLWHEHVHTVSTTKLRERIAA